MDKTFQIANDQLTTMERTKLKIILWNVFHLSETFTDSDLRSIERAYQSTVRTLLDLRQDDSARMRFVQEEVQLSIAVNLMTRIATPDDWTRRRCVMLRNAIVHWNSAREVIDAYKCGYCTPILGTYVARTSHLKGKEYEDFLFLYKEAVGVGRFNEVTAAATPVFDHGMF